MSEPLDVARIAALAGGDVLRSHLGRVRQIRTKTSSADLVTEVDVASGVAVVRAIAEARSEARFIVEEPEVYELAAIEPGDPHASEVWVVDPLDGTTSYVHGYPCYSVSIAMLRDGVAQVGAVYNVASGEMNVAARGAGATRDGRPLRAGRSHTIEDSLLVTGFPYDRGRLLDRQLSVFDRLVHRVHGVRRDGSAAIDCCHVAAGSADGFWEFALKVWDTAAGALIAQEAGALVTDFTGAPWSPETTDTLAANPALHPILLEAIAEAVEAGGFGPA